MTIGVGQAPRWVRLCGLVYLLLPTLVFVFGWLRLAWSIPVTGLLLFSVWRFHADKDDTETIVGLPPRKILAVLASALLGWMLLSGIGGFSFQNPDFHFRNAILRDLLENPWPVVWNFDYRGGPNRDVLFTYYHAFFLPAAAAGKILGWQAANIVLWVWAFAGVAITWLLILPYIGRRPLLLLLFPVFSGLDILGRLLLHYNEPLVIPYQHIEWWTAFMVYSSHATQLYWVFNQAVPAWIATLLVLSLRRSRNSWLPLALSIPFAPLPVVGLAPFVARLTLVGRLGPGTLSLGQRIREGASAGNLAAALAILPVFGSYFSGNASAQMRAFTLDQPILWVFWAIFLFAEVVPYAAATFLMFRREVVWWMALGILAVAPMVKLGIGADFCMRVSIPALLILFLSVLVFLDSRPEGARARWIRRSLLFVLLLGSVTAWQEIARSVRLTSAHYLDLPPPEITGRLVTPPEDRARDGFLLADSMRTLGKSRLDHNQYIFTNFYAVDFQADPFWRWFARHPVAQGRVDR